MRLNPDIGEEPPKLYEVEKMLELKHATEAAIRADPLTFDIRRVARMLIASTFYFRASSKPRLVSGSSDYSLAGEL